jgi:hypothetical protein
VTSGHRQHVADPAVLQRGPQARVGPHTWPTATNAAGTPASNAARIIRWASAGLVATEEQVGVEASFGVYDLDSSLGDAESVLDSDAGMHARKATRRD